MQDEAKSRMYSNEINHLFWLQNMTNIWLNTWFLKDFNVFDNWNSCLKLHEKLHKEIELETVSMLTRHPIFQASQ